MESRQNGVFVNVAILGSPSPPQPSQNTHFSLFFLAATFSYLFREDFSHFRHRLKRRIPSPGRTLLHGLSQQFAAFSCSFFAFSFSHIYVGVRPLERDLVSLEWADTFFWKTTADISLSLIATWMGAPEHSWKSVFR